ncbi:MAG: hypothetical protein OXI57_13470 [Rhodospirillales bacterium]|nr:hypothetical protein [Rhodospirillales bacterium]
MSSKGIEDAETDIVCFRRALDLAPPEDAFMTAASQGPVSMFLGNVHHRTEEEFLYAVADAMMPEYRAIA